MHIVQGRSGNGIEGPPRWGEGEGLEPREGEVAGRDGSAARAVLPRECFSSSGAAG